MTTGRKTRYDPRRHPQRAEELVGKGVIDRELARALGIAESTLYEWQNRHPEFSEAIKRAKAKPDAEVEAALFKRALGYTLDTDEVTASGDKDRDGHQKILKVVRKKVHVAGDVAAQIFWLKNRRPREWRDTFHVHQTFNPEAGLEGVTPDDEAAVAAQVKAILGNPGGNGNGTR